MTLPFLPPATAESLTLPPVHEGLFGKRLAISTTSTRDALVIEAAKRHGVPVQLALAVSRVENTHGLPKARGAAGEVGLMQVMPGVHRLQPEQLEDPAFNVDFGVRLLRNYFERHASWDRALRAYNGALRNTKAGDAYVGKVRAAMKAETRG